MVWACVTPAEEEVVMRLALRQGVSISLYVRQIVLRTIQAEQAFSLKEQIRTA